MYARLYVPLRFWAVVRPDDLLPPMDVDEAEFRFQIFPPYKSQLSPNDLYPYQDLPIVEIGHRLAPADPQPMPVVLDDKPASVADAMRIDIHGASLTRQAGVVEPAIERAFAVGNRFLERLRVVAFAPSVQPLWGEWQLVYLQDDGSVFEPDPTGQLVRARFAARLHSPAMPILTPDVWQAIGELADEYSAPPWETLLLDAFRLLPEIGSPIVLAASAIETRIESALRLLADVHGSPVAEVWTWVNDRREYWREPSVKDQVSVLLGALGKQSLLETGLWEAFQNLRKARNEYVHKGIPRIGTEIVTSQRAAELVEKAREILDWIEEQLPEEARRPRLAVEHEFKFERALIGAPPEPAGED